MNISGRIVLALVAVATLATRAPAQAAAQEGGFTSLGSYAFAVPIGDTRRFAGAPSWMGFTWDGEWATSNRTGLGVGLGVHDFFNRSNGTMEFPIGSVTGEQMRDLLAVSLTGTGRWYAGGPNRRRPFLGLGLGTLYTHQNYQLGLANPLTSSGWHWLVAPEVGFMIPVYDRVDAVTSVRFAAPTSAGQYIGGGARRFQFATITIGIIER